MNESMDDVFSCELDRRTAAKEGGHFMPANVGAIVSVVAALHGSGLGDERSFFSESSSMGVN